MRVNWDKVVLYFEIATLICCIFNATNLAISQTYRLIVKLNKNVLKPEELLIITVQVLSGDTPIPSAIVGVEIRNPDNNPILLEIGKTDINGVAKFFVKIGKKWPSGKYTVWVALSGTSVKATEYFFIITKGIKVKEYIISAEDFNGKPLANALITLFFDSKKIKLKTDKSGAVVANLTNGEYRIEVIWKGVKVYSGILALTERVIRIKCEVYQIRFFVKEKYTGKPLENVLILLKLPDGSVIKTTTNVDGEAILYQVPKGVYNVHIGGKVFQIKVYRNEDFIIELEPKWIYFLPILIVIILASIIYIIRASRRK